MGNENSQFGQTPPPRTCEEHGSSNGTVTPGSSSARTCSSTCTGTPGSSSANSPKDEEYMGEFQSHLKFFSLTIFKTSVTEARMTGGIKVTKPRTSSRKNSRMLSKSVNGVAHDQVEITALPDSGTLKLKLRPISVINNEDYFFEITFESAPALEAQSHSLFHEAAAEMMRRNTHREEVVSQLRSEPQHYHRHAEGQSDAFQQSQAALRQHLERSDTEGAQFGSRHEET